MKELISIATPICFIFGIVWLIISSNKRINNALTLASEALGFTSVLSKIYLERKRYLVNLMDTTVKLKCTQEVMESLQQRMSLSLFTFQRVLIWD